MKQKEAPGDLVIPANNKKMMIRFFFSLMIFILFIVSCTPTKKIQTAIIKKDKDTVAAPIVNHAHEDSMLFIQNTYKTILTHQIDFKTFSAKIDVDYIDADDKRYNVNVFLRMYKDSMIWVDIHAFLGIDALKAIITKDSVKIIDKQNKLYTARSIAYLQEVSQLAVDLPTLQDLLIGNVVFLDSNIVSYAKFDNSISLLSIGRTFKNLITLNEDQMVQRIKLDDLNELRNRTGDLTYDDYEDKMGVDFAKTRKITFAEKKKLDVRLSFKQYNFNEDLTFPFSIPKNYKRN
jgi:Domain of unknown function (DUF4292)